MSVRAKRTWEIRMHIAKSYVNIKSRKPVSQFITDQFDAANQIAAANIANDIAAENNGAIIHLRLYEVKLAGLPIDASKPALVVDNSAKFRDQDFSHIVTAVRRPALPAPDKSSHGCDEYDKTGVLRDCSWARRIKFKLNLDTVGGIAWVP